VLRDYPALFALSVLLTAGVALGVGRAEQSSLLGSLAPSAPGLWTLQVLLLSALAGVAVVLPFGYDSQGERISNTTLLGAALALVLLALPHGVFIPLGAWLGVFVRVIRMSPPPPPGSGPTPAPTGQQQQQQQQQPILRSSSGRTPQRGYPTPTQLAQERAPTPGVQAAAAASSAAVGGPFPPAAPVAAPRLPVPPVHRFVNPPTRYDYDLQSVHHQRHSPWRASSSLGVGGGLRRRSTGSAGEGARVGLVGYGASYGAGGRYGGYNADGGRALRYGGGGGVGDEDAMDVDDAPPAGPPPLSPPAWSRSRPANGLAPYEEVTYDRW
jgi:hypothetical protein